MDLRWTLYTVSDTAYFSPCATIFFGGGGLGRLVDGRFAIMREKEPGGVPSVLTAVGQDGPRLFLTSNSQQSIWLTLGPKALFDTASYGQSMSVYFSRGDSSFVLRSEGEKLKLQIKREGKWTTLAVGPDTLLPGDLQFPKPAITIDSQNNIWFNCYTKALVRYSNKGVCERFDTIAEAYQTGAARDTLFTIASDRSKTLLRTWNGATWSTIRELSLTHGQWLGFILTSQLVVWKNELYLYGPVQRDDYGDSSNLLRYAHGELRAVHLDSSSSLLAASAGGDWLYFAGTSAVMRYNGSELQVLGSYDGAVFGLHYSAPSLVAVGSFSRMNGVASRNIAVWYPWEASVSTLPTTSSSLRVYPNPAFSSCTIVSASGGQGAVKICDLTGKVVRSAEMAGGKANVDLHGLSSGYYLCNVITEHGEESAPLLVQ